MNYFNVKNDSKVVEAGDFFCESCLIGKPQDDQSQDLRYCQGCFDFLLQEADMLPATKRPKWIPKIRRGKTIPVAGHHVVNMSTVNDKNSTVDIFHPLTPKVTLRKKRGPRQQDLPVDLITQWAGDGIGYKRIAARLGDEHNITISYRTVARVVKGERLLI